MAFGNEDFLIIHEFGNVKTRIVTSGETEEIEKVSIIGQLTEMLCKEYNYKRPVFIDFINFGGGDCKLSHFVSFENDLKIDDHVESTFTIYKDALVIREEGRQFSISAILNLVEYAIKNADKIKSGQSVIDRHNEYWRSQVKTIDTAQIRLIACVDISNVVRKVMETKILWREPKSKYGKRGFSWYFKHCQYQVVYNKNTSDDSVLLSLDNIHQLQAIKHCGAIVFDTDSSFYFLSTVKYPHSSRRNIINYAAQCFDPIRIEKDSNGYIKFTFYYYKPDNNTLLERRMAFYNPVTDELWQE